MKHQIHNHPKTGIPYMASDDVVKGYSKSKTAKKERNDCVVLAIAAVTGSSYDKSHKYVKDTFNRPKGGGTPRFDYLMKKNQGKKLLGSTYERVTNHTETTYSKKRKVYNWSTHEYEVIPTEITIKSKFVPLITTYGKTRVSQMTVKTFLNDYNVGKYLIHVRAHAFAILDGVVVGNICDSRRLKARIVNAYKFN